MVQGPYKLPPLSLPTLRLPPLKNAPLSELVGRVQPPIRSKLAQLPPYTISQHLAVKSFLKDLPLEEKRLAWADLRQKHYMSLRYRRNREVLPLHLSYGSALVLLPPPHVIHFVDMLRKRHDRNQSPVLWPVHMNLIYPFLHQPSRTEKSVRSRIARALEGLQPFSGQCDAVAWYRHQRGVTTGVFEPSGDLAFTANLVQLYRRLQEEFVECDGETRRDRAKFLPHVSFASTLLPQDEERVGEDVETLLKEYWGLPSNEGGETGAETSNGGATTGQQKRPWKMMFNVGRVVVLEKRVVHHKFKVAFEVPFGDQKVKKT